jgi:BON domain-containing protein
MEPLERRYFGGDDRTPARRRRRRGEPVVGWQIGPGVGGAGDATLAPGPQAERGPDDDKRTDERIREDIGQWMSDDPRLDTREIDVRVQDGDVTLEGRVAHRAARRLAEDIAAAVPGVRKVLNRLKTRDRRSA